ncbi:MAG: hypothetical protein ACKO5F_00465 [Synechococcus sp.]
MASSAHPGLRLVRFAVQALRITASTVALVALVRQQWIAAACFGAGWLLVLRAQRWLPEEAAGEAADNPGP